MTIWDMGVPYMSSDGEQKLLPWPLHVVVMVCGLAI